MNAETAVPALRLAGSPKKNKDHNEMSDWELVNIWQSYYTQVFQYHRLNDPELCAAEVTEAAEQALREGKVEADGAAIRRYMRGTANNIRSNRWRQHYRDPHLLGVSLDEATEDGRTRIVAEATFATDASQDADAGAEALRALVHAAIGPEMLEILQLYMVDRLGAKEIAIQFGITAEAVRQRVFRAKRILEPIYQSTLPLSRKAGTNRKTIEKSEKAPQ